MLLAFGILGSQLSRAIVASRCFRRRVLLGMRARRAGRGVSVLAACLVPGALPVSLVLALSVPASVAALAPCIPASLAPRLGRRLVGRFVALGRRVHAVASATRKRLRRVARTVGRGRRRECSRGPRGRRGVLLLEDCAPSGSHLHRTEETVHRLLKACPVVDGALPREEAADDALDENRRLLLCVLRLRARHERPLHERTLGAVQLGCSLLHPLAVRLVAPEVGECRLRVPRHFTVGRPRQRVEGVHEGVQVHVLGGARVHEHVLKEGGYVHFRRRTRAHGGGRVHHHLEAVQPANGLDAAKESNVGETGETEVHVVGLARPVRVVLAKQHDEPCDDALALAHL
mmetsp:Transcript_17667/g.51334  ORF Transcript_17667/g.51334 Transcript_17667/m.51334 type:complete len:345 (-) Transcript_17667:170-1204(-)